MDKKRLKKIYELYLEGKSGAAIGEKYGISRQRVLQILSMHPDWRGGRNRKLTEM